MSVRTTRHKSVATPADIAFAREMLPAVSRTFARAIEVLPQALAAPVRLAYLLCRVADTIEDATSIDAPWRLELLLRFGSFLSAKQVSEQDIKVFSD